MTEENQNKKQKAEDQAAPQSAKRPELEIPRAVDSATLETFSFCIFQLGKNSSQ